MRRTNGGRWGARRTYHGADRRKRREVGRERLGLRVFGPDDLGVEAIAALSRRQGRRALSDGRKRRREIRDASSEVTDGGFTCRRINFPRRPRRSALRVYHTRRSATRSGFCAWRFWRMGGFPRRIREGENQRSFVAEEICSSRHPVATECRIGRLGRRTPHVIRARRCPASVLDIRPFVPRNGNPVRRNLTSAGLLGLGARLKAPAL